ncbi:Methyl-CpG-binding domain protein 6 [Papilio machaon]|uniref:Methyl-CpG-binding domain protein 6 n=1 Tax=Papilio machaon TaxID=76193 RepID=A0A0N1IBV0_PAPMA|nr:Methyl-CpG-binding domain protein 6 [Papilio machaon]
MKAMLSPLNSIKGPEQERPAFVCDCPSGTVLSALSQLREYLQTAGTCKCGLPCPLRPETAFSFDPKVVSKQYQPASGAELTKLCNHKRKLLATLQTRAHSPATPPPHPPQPHHNMEQKKGLLH